MRCKVEKECLFFDNQQEIRVYIEKIIKSHNPLFIAAWLDWGEICLSDDREVYKIWIIDNNESASYYSVCANNKISIKNPITLSKKFICELVELLNSGFDRYTRNFDCCDGCIWVMKYFNGNQLHTFEGYIYGNEYLESIAEKIKSLNF